MKKHLLLVLLSCLFLSVHAGLIQGLVFEDLNLNGRKDASEKALANIPVSNGFEVVLTDAGGRFQLNVNSGEAVFAIPPHPYTMKRGASLIGNASFQLVNDSTPSKGTCLIPLSKGNNSASFRLALVGDIQVDDEQQLAYTESTFLRDRLNNANADMYLIMGDLVNEKPDLQPRVRALLEKLEAPVWTVYGNHDRNLKYGAAQNEWFTRQMGVTDYAFNKGKAHFIVLNNVQPKGKMGYEGGLTERQLQFVSNDLKTVSFDKQVVVAMHIPLDETRGSEQLIRLLEPYRHLTVLTAHLHTTGRLIHRDQKGRVFQEVLSGAVCGSWWTGERDDRGISSGMMQCGSPRNYYLLDFSEKGIKVTFKGIQQEPSHQMNVWIQGLDTLDQHIPMLAEELPGTILANIFGASDSSLVTIQLDDQTPVRMEQIKTAAPEVARIVASAKANLYPTANSKRAALRIQDCPHLWRICFEKKPSVGAHLLTIRASDRFGFSVEEKIIWEVGKN